MHIQRQKWVTDKMNPPTIEKQGIEKDKLMIKWRKVQPFILLDCENLDTITKTHTLIFKPHDTTDMIKLPWSMIKIKIKNVAVVVKMSNKHNDNSIHNVNEKRKIIAEEKTKIINKKKTKIMIYTLNIINW